MSQKEQKILHRISGWTVSKDIVYIVRYLDLAIGLIGCTCCRKNTNSCARLLVYVAQGPKNSYTAIGVEGF